MLEEVPLNKCIQYLNIQTLHVKCPVLIILCKYKYRSTISLMYLKHKKYSIHQAADWPPIQYYIIQCNKSYTKLTMFYM